MAFVTYILAVALHYGLKSDFRPDILGVKASTGLFVVLLDFLFVKLGCYLLNIQVRSPLRLPFSMLCLPQFQRPLTPKILTSCRILSREQVKYWTY